MKLLRKLLTTARGSGKVAATAQVLAMRVLAMAVNLCTGLLTAAVLGPEGRGVQAALILAPQFVASVATLGLHASLVYNIKSDPAREAQYLGCALLLILAAGFAGSAVAWWLLPVWLGQQYNAATISVARLLLLLAPVGMVATLIGASLEARGKFAIANRSLYLNGLTTLGLLLLLWLFGRLTPAAAAAAYLLPSVAMLVYLAANILPLVRPVFTLAQPWRGRVLHYGLRFCGVDVLGAMAGYLDQMVIVLFLAPQAMGVYAVGWSLSRVLGVLQAAISTVLFPSIAARSPDQVMGIIGICVRVMTTLNLLGAAVLGVAGPWLLVLLYGHGFAGAIGPFRILLAETVVANAARVLYQAYSGTGRPGVVTIIESVGVAVSIASMLLLVPQFGTIGAASAVLIASCVRLVCVMAGLPFILRVRMPRLFLGGADIRWIRGRWTGDQWALGQ